MDFSKAAAGGPLKKMPAFVIIPPALLLIACAGAVLQRTTAAHTIYHNQSGAKDMIRFGSTGDAEARAIANKVCTQLTGEAAQSVDVSFQSAFSNRRGKATREWDVLCNTEAALYLVRINSDTGRVYGINRMGAGGANPADALERLNNDKGLANAAPDAEETNALPLSGAAAEARAKRYLQVIGVSPDALHSVSQSRSQTVDDFNQWNFTFRRRVPGAGSRLVKVSLDGSGQLTHIWNPVCSL